MPELPDGLCHQAGPFSGVTQKCRVVYLSYKHSSIYIQNTGGGINQLPALSVPGSVRCSATNWRPDFADTWGRHCRGRDGLGCCTGTAPGLCKIRTTWAIPHVVFIVVWVLLVSSNKRQAPNAESGPSTDPCTELF